MIVLEIRFPKYFWNASRILEKSELQFRSQHSLEDCCSNFIWFFEEDLKTTDRGRP